MNWGWVERRCERVDLVAVAHPRSYPLCFKPPCPFPLLRDVPSKQMAYVHVDPMEIEQPIKK